MGSTVITCEIDQFAHSQREQKASHLHESENYLIQEHLYLAQERDLSFSFLKFEDIWYRLDQCNYTGKMIKTSVLSQLKHLRISMTQQHIRFLSAYEKKALLLNNKKIKYLPY